MKKRNTKLSPRLKDPKKIAEAKEQRRLVLIEKRIRNLVDYTAGKGIRLQRANVWAFDPVNKILYYATEGKVGLKSMTKGEFIGTTFHEIGHAKYTGKPSDLDALKSPQREYQVLFNCLEDCRIEKKLMQEFPGTEDSFANYRENIAKNLYTEEQLLKLPTHLNLSANILRKEYGFDPLINDESVDMFLKTHDEDIQLAIRQPSTKSLQKFMDNVLWEDFKKVVPEYWNEENDQEGGEAQDQPYMNTNSHLDQSTEEDKSKKSDKKEDEEEKDPGNVDQLIKNGKEEEDEDKPSKPQTGVTPPPPPNPKPNDKKGDKKGDKEKQEEEAKKEEENKKDGGKVKEVKGDK